jgi:hypothetical protein
MTTEQIITFATPLALIIATIIQKMDILKAARDTKASEAKVLAHANRMEERVVERAKEVQEHLEENNRQRNRQLTTIHTLVNSGMSEQKRINMLLAKRVAKMTGDALDLKVADDAERIYMEHEAKQSVVDKFQGQGQGQGQGQDQGQGQGQDQATAKDWDQIKTYDKKTN